MYGNHDAVGAALRRAGVPRAEVFLVSKVNTNKVRAAQAAMLLSDGNAPGITILSNHRHP